MKVGLIGNVNNNFFVLTRYLRDRGINAHLFLLNGESPHFHPSADTFDDDYKKYTQQLDWGRQFSFFKTNAKQISQCFRDFDFLIGCNYAPAFLHKAGRRLDLFAPHGCDIFNYPFFNLSYNYLMPFLTLHQRRGIENSQYILLDEINPEWDAVIKRLQFKGKRLKTAVPFIYTPLFKPDPIDDCYKQSSWYISFKNIRQKHDIVVFHHSSHVWKNIPREWPKGSTKGNDKVIEGFAEFVKKRRDIKACLILFEYGRDVVESKKLVKRLGIEESVVWLPVMCRRDIFIGINFADIGIGEIGLSFLSYGTIYEFISMGKPVIYRREDPIYKNIYPDLFPMTDAKNAKDITEALISYADDPLHFKKMGDQAREWYLNYGIERPLKIIMNIIEKN